VDGAIERIDASHLTPRSISKTLQPAPVELAMAAAGHPTEQSRTQLHVQADQLATYLLDRQRDVDGRESQLNVRVAQLENELRSARLWVREQEHEFSEKELGLQQRVSDLESRLQALSASELTIEETQKQLQQEIQQREQRLGEREQKLLEGQQRLVDEAEELGVTSERLKRQRVEVEEASQVEKQQTARDREAADEQHGKLLAQIEQSKQTLDEQEERLAESKQTLDEQEESLAESKRALDEQEESLAQRKQAVDEQEECLVQHKQAVDEQEERLGQRKQDVDEQEERLGELAKHKPATEFTELQERQDQARKKQLDDAEAMLAEHRSDLSDDRQLFELERELAQAELVEERQLLVEREQEIEEQDRASRQSDESRSIDVDRRVAAAEQVKQESLETFREALEMRILVEELWADVSKSTPPALITQRLGQLRVRLTEQFRLDRQDLAQRRTELQELGQRLEVRSRKLHEQRDELKNWMQQRESHVESQAARLVNRELELDHETDRFTAFQREWASEKRQLQSQVRQLGGDLRRATAETL
jgi:epidermal growth factor receptor substrate 15